MPIKQNDFVEIEYTGRVKETGEVFDTTDEKTAKEANIYSEKAEYQPVVVCVGQGQLLQGLDEFLLGREAGEFMVDVPAEKAFGKKRSDLMKMVPVGKFSEHKIKPVPGLQVNIDGAVGTVKTVSGGRCVVDFNHPLAGQDVEYKVKVNRVVEGKKEQVAALLKILLGIREPPVEVKDSKATVTLPAELPKQVTDELAKRVKELTGVDAEFAVGKK